MREDDVDSQHIDQAPRRRRAVLLAIMTATTNSAPPGTASVTDASQALLEAADATP